MNYDPITETGLYRVEYEEGMRWELWVVEKNKAHLRGYAVSRLHGEELMDEYMFLTELGVESVNDVKSSEILIH